MIELKIAENITEKSFGFQGVIVVLIKIVVKKIYNTKDVSQSLDSVH